MNPAPPASTAETLAATAELQGAERRRRRWLVRALALAVLVVAVVLVITDPFHSSPSGSSGGFSDNEYPTSTMKVMREPLTQQTQVNGTLGFAGDTTIRLPGGTAPTVVMQAQQQVTSDLGMVSTARSSLSSDQATLAQAQATLSADQQQESVDCAGDNAAQAAASGAGSGGSSGGCAGAAQLASSDQQAVTSDGARVTADQQSLTQAQHGLATAQGDLATDVAQETAYGQGSTYTYLPSDGTIIHRGQRLFGINRQPVLLLYGDLVATSAFYAGMPPGPDVRELNDNLDALHLGHGLGGDDNFTAATAAAVRALQARSGMDVTGELPLGSVIFETGAQRVTSVMPTAAVGSGVSPGGVLTTSSTARQVTISLDAGLEGQVTVGDPVTITLPDNQTTPGKISYISPVASDQGGSPAVQVDAVPTDPAATGDLDQAPVDVSITTASVASALVVPVDALLALSSGGYAVEEIAANGAHHLVAVSTGLFDDADGLVAVSGAGLAAGQRVVVPGV